MYTNVSILYNSTEPRDSDGAVVFLTIERIVSSHVKYTTKWWQWILLDSITGINELELGGESSSKLLVKVNARVI